MKAALSIAGIILAGIALYFANEWRVCSTLEDDFLGSIDGYTAGVEADAMAGSVGVEIDLEERRRLQDSSLRLQQMQLERIYERCGDDAGRAAAELASDELQESMKDVLSLPL